MITALITGGSLLVPVLLLLASLVWRRLGAICSIGFRERKKRRKRKYNIPDIPEYP